MSRTYPKPIGANEIYVGLSVCLFMTFRGNERAKHGSQVDDWCIDGVIEALNNNIITVSSPDTSEHYYFYADIKLREVGKAEPDYRLFRDREEALNYEYYRDLRRTYHANNREKDNERTKAWEDSHQEERKEYRKNRRSELSNEISAQSHKSYEAHKEGKRQYYLDNKEKIDSFQKQYRKDNKERIKENNRRYNASHKDEIRLNRIEWRKAHRDEINKNARLRYAKKKAEKENISE